MSGIRSALGPLIHHSTDPQGGVLSPCRSPWLQVCEASTDSIMPQLVEGLSPEERTWNPRVKSHREACYCLSSTTHLNSFPPSLWAAHASSPGRNHDSSLDPSSSHAPYFCPWKSILPLNSNSLVCWVVLSSLPRVQHPLVTQTGPLLPLWWRDGNCVVCKCPLPLQWHPGSRSQPSPDVPTSLSETGTLCVGSSIRQRS